MKRFSDLSDTVQLFREGGFGTVDEFSFLAGRTHPQQVHEMKQLVGIIMALHNPEGIYGAPSGKTTSGFESSDYYPLIQRIFREKDEVRNDLAILTYNYDAYFDFLLSRAYFRRAQASGKSRNITPTELTSGFADRDAKKLSEGKGFCLLKLHGTAVFPDQMKMSNIRDDYLLYEDVFWGREIWTDSQDPRRFQSNLSPAMYFPWELIGTNKEFVGQDVFSGLENLTPTNGYFQSTGRTIYGVCKAIWERAQHEISQADKISFVGLSMHEFLKGGLTYLFANRRPKAANMPENVQVVLASPGALSHGTKFSNLAHPLSLAGKLMSTLVEVYPTFKNWMPPDLGKSGTGQVVCYEDFEAFIKSEL